MSNPAQPAPKPLGYHEAFKHLDAVEIARTDLEATFHILSLMIGPGRERYEDVVPKLEHCVTTDLANLEAACNAAWEAILLPLHAVAFPGAPPMGTPNTLADGAGEEAGGDRVDEV